MLVPNEMKISKFCNFETKSQEMILISNHLVNCLSSFGSKILTLSVGYMCKKNHENMFS
jgi:hypothetical protein